MQLCCTDAAGMLLTGRRDLVESEKACVCAALPLVLITS